MTELLMGSFFGGVGWGQGLGLICVVLLCPLKGGFCLLCHSSEKEYNYSANIGSITVVVLCLLG